MDNDPSPGASGGSPEGPRRLTGRPAAHWRYHIDGTGALASGLRAWASSLFPLPDRSARRRPKLIVAGTYLVVLVLLSTVALLRQSGLPATRTIWAEDGSIFYADAVRLSFWKTLLRPYSGYGQLVIVDHGGAIETYYAHLSRFAVVEGQEVRRGEQVGAVGSTGRVTAPHLHYEVRLGGAPVNPHPYLARAGVVQMVKKDFPF